MLARFRPCIYRTHIAAPSPAARGPTPKGLQHRRPRVSSSSDGGRGGVFVVGAGYAHPMTDWHPLLAAQEKRAGRWIMVDPMNREYGTIELVRVSLSTA